MANATRPVRPRQAQPVTGTARVLRAFGLVNDHTAEVAINGKPYYLAWTGHGFRLVTLEDRTGRAVAYDLPADLAGCDCADSIFRDRPTGCKHRLALAALVRAGKLTPPAAA